MPIQRSGTGAPLGLPAPNRPVSLQRRSFDRGYNVDDVLKALKQQKEAAAPRSLWDQVTDSFTGLAKGALGMGLGIAKSTISAPLKAIDLAQGDISPMDFAQSMAPDYIKFGNAAAANVAGNGQSPEMQQKINDLTGVTIGMRYDPVQTGAGTSWGNTILDARHPTRFAQAVREGRIVDKVIEDASNIAMVAGPAAKLFQGAGMSRAAAGAEFAAAPIRGTTAALGRGLESVGFEGIGKGLQGNVVRNAAGGIRRGVLSGVEKGLEADKPWALSLRQRVPGLSPEGIAANEAKRFRALETGRVVNNTWRDAHEYAQQHGYNVDAEAAAYSMLNSTGEGRQFLAERLGVSPDEVQALVGTQSLPEQHITPGAQQIIADYKAGTLDDATRAAVEDVMSYERERIGKLTDRNLEGVGRQSGGLDPAQLENNPIDAQMMKRIPGEPGVSVDDVQAILDWREQGLSWDDIAEAVPQVKDIMNSDYGVWPARWRPLMREMSLARKANPDATVPFRPDELLAAGLPDPTYLPGGRSKLFEKRQFKVPVEEVNRSLDGIKGMGSEKNRVSGEVQPMSLRTSTEKVVGQYRDMISNEATQRFVNDPRVRNVSQLIPEGELATLKQEAQREAALRFPKGDGRIGAETQLIFGNKIAGALRERGFAPLQGDVLNPQVGDFTPGKSAEAMTIGPDTKAVPESVLKSIEGRTVPRFVNAPLEVMRYINRKFKNAVLPMSLKWQQGDAIGGAIMAWVGGGVDPLTLAESMTKLKKLTPDAYEAILKHPEFVDRGINMQSIEWQRNLALDNAPANNPVAKGWAKFKEKSFGLNNTINHYNRGGYLLAKVDKLLAKEGLSVESVDAAGPGAWEQPHVQQAITEAVQDANKTMGAFDDMTPIEQRYLREILPFYAWVRHISLLAARTAIDNPARIMWTMRLGSIGTDPNEDLPPWLKGSIPIPDGAMPDFLFGPGDGVLPLQYLNPFNDVVTSPGFSPAGIVRGLSPAIKVPMALAGIEPAANNQASPFQMITRPYGQDRGFSGAFQDALYSGLRSFPITREGINALPTSDGAWYTGGIGTGPNVRYHSGDLMIGPDGNPIQSPTSSPNPRALIPLRLVSLPLPTNLEDAQAIQQAQQKRAVVGAAKKKKVRVKLGQTTKIKIGR